MSKTSWLAKRVFDVTLVLLSLPLTLPLMGLVALLVRVKLGAPVLFVQPRPGYRGQIFRLVKFRTMREALGPDGKPLPDGQRLTRLGRLLRASSLDELPELWNVLRGEMSLVGPRPALESEVDAYAPWHRRRLDALPGMTGLWQVSGRSDLTFDEMVLLDIYYIENWSPLLDLRIMLKTIPVVLLGKGAY